MIEKPTILIVEDEDDIREGIRILLSGESYHIIEANNGSKALQLMNDEVDLIILDVMMPGMSGFRVCEEIRKKYTAPILFLTALAQESDKLVGLTAGGDDYLIKPFSFAELTARVKALLRRYYVYQGKDQLPSDHDVEKLSLNGITIELNRNRVWVNNKEISLTDTEYRILLMLMRQPKHIFSTQELYEAAWRETYFHTSSGTVMVHIRKLRTKIESDPQNPEWILTVWGKGYRFGWEKQEHETA